MTAYVHIGTEKTGTTSIQTFLSNNRDLLHKRRIVYPNSLGNNGSQWNFAFLAYNNIRDDWYCVDRKIYTKYDFKNYKNKVFFDLKKELKKSKYQKLLISSEHLSSRLQDLKEVKRCKKILNILGFKEIKIIVYLREQNTMASSSFSTDLKDGKNTDRIVKGKEFAQLGDYKKLLHRWQEVFGKENLIVKLFDKDEFYQGDLLKDFMYSIDLKWDDKFITPPRQNETLDLIGIELLKRINKHLPWQVENKINVLRGDFSKYLCKYFQNSKDYYLKFQPAKEMIQSYINYFEESNEWVRKEFFPDKERLFPKKDLTDYKENYELKEMKSEYWDRIAEFIVDIVKAKNQIIQNKDKQMAILINEKSNFQIQISQLQNILNSLSTKKELKNSNLKQGLTDKKIQVKQLNGIIECKTVSFSKTVAIGEIGTAKSRIQNQLSYKLGQTMIINSKNISGILFMPLYIISTLLSHRQEKK
ncbi:hypothetical protein ACP0SK_09120, partial [Campylobacter coli]